MKSAGLRQLEAEVVAMLRALADSVEDGEYVKVVVMRDEPNSGDEVQVTVKMSDRLKLNRGMMLKEATP